MQHLAFGTPRKLPKASSLDGRVVVLDIAFAGAGTGGGFKKITLPLIEGLGERLGMWVDHHDSEEHALYKGDPRFVLATKAEHGACPEMITPELVARAGRIDTIVCHTDFDGLASAASGFATASSRTQAATTTRAPSTPASARRARQPNASIARCVHASVTRACSG